MTLLLPRAKSSHSLAILLSVLLALPSNFPTLDREDARPGLESFAPASACHATGCRIHRTDRKACHHLEDWSVIADEPEAPAGLDDFRFTPLAIPHRPIDLPSLVPAALVARPPRPVGPVASPAHTPPLRC